MRQPETYLNQHYGSYPWGEAYHHWVQTNPLRAWRVGQRSLDPTLRDPDFQRILGVSIENIRLLERGCAIPMEPRLAHLAKVTGIRDLSVRWKKWLWSFPSEIPLDDLDLQHRAPSLVKLQRVLRAAA